MLLGCGNEQRLSVSLFVERKTHCISAMTALTFCVPGKHNAVTNSCEGSPTIGRKRSSVCQVLQWVVIVCQYLVQTTGRMFGTPLSMLIPDKGPLLVRAGDVGWSGFFDLGASRGRPDQPMLLSPEPHTACTTLNC